MKISKDKNGNKVLQITGAELGLKRGFSIQTNGNLPYAHKNGLSCELTAKAEAFNYIAEHGTAAQKASMQTECKYNLQNVRVHRLNGKPFFKELSVSDISALVDLFGSRCQQHTKDRLWSAFYNLATLKGAWFFERIMWSNGRWSYCAGQDYTAEISSIRNELVKG